MATIDLGKIKQVWRGTYNNGTAYTVDDLVAYTDTVGGLQNTSTYICVTNSTGNAPASGGSIHASWNLVAQGVPDRLPSQSGNADKFLKTDGSSVTWDDASGILLIENGGKYKGQILAIGGGGAGGYTDSGFAGGGGGAGGMAYHDGFMFTDGDAYTISIGSGANGPTSDSQMGQLNNSQAPNGGNTTISGTGLLINARGGGGGAGYNGAYLAGAAGGCGGGSEGYALAYPGNASYARQAIGGTSAFGTHGGYGAVNQGNFGDGLYAAGGGGGVGSGPLQHRTVGGGGSSAFHEWLAAVSEGVEVSGIRYLGGGGGGGIGDNSSTRQGGVGGNGGGGQGGDNTGSSGGDATHYTGSGGGGRGYYNAGSGRGGNGGNGIVIIRYPANKGQKATGGTVTLSGGYYYHVFKSGGTFTA